MHRRCRLGLVIPGFFLAVVAVAETPALGSAQLNAVQRERLAQIKVPGCRRTRRSASARSGVGSRGLQLYGP